MICPSAVQTWHIRNNGHTSAKLLKSDDNKKTATPGNCRQAAIHLPVSAPSDFILKNNLAAAGHSGIACCGELYIFNWYLLTEILTDWKPRLCPPGVVARRCLASQAAGVAGNSQCMQGACVTDCTCKCSLPGTRGSYAWPDEQIHNFEPVKISVKRYWNNCPAGHVFRTCIFVPNTRFK